MISVVTACYNGEKYIYDYLNSLNSQTIPFELVFVNDGSTDNTVDILYKFKFKDHINLKIIDRHNKGFHFSLIEGISASSNNLIARLDVDDIWEYTHLSSLYNLYVSNQNLVLIGSSASLINSKNEQIGIICRNLHNDQIRKYLLKDNPFFHSSVLFRKDIYLKTKGYNFGDTPSAILMADYYLWVQMSAIGDVRIIPNLSMKYRVLNESMSRTVNKIENYKARLQIMKIAKKLYGTYFLYGLIWRILIRIKIKFLRLEKMVNSNIQFY